MIKKIAKKYNLFYPRNDIEAYKMYPEHNFIYNKLELFKYQKLDCNPLPILPNKFPVVVKPIINLKGMGLDSIIINNINEYNNHSTSGFFYCTFLSGKHYSWDLIINDGKIVYYTVFQGYKYKEENRFGTFKYWKQEEKPLLKIIKQYIDDKFKNFTGHINIETIGNYMIEGHLRLGDIDFCMDDIILLALLNLNKKDISKQLDIVLNIKLVKKYLVPVWMDNILNTKDLQDIYNYIEDNIEIDIIEDNMVTGYYFDNPSHPSPQNFRRWLLLIGDDFNYLKKIANKFTKNINNFIKT